MSALPTGWSEVELDEVFGRKRGSALAPAKQPDQRFELYSVPAFQTGRPERPLGAEVGSSKQTVAPGTVLLCRINPRINRVWIVGNARTSRRSLRLSGSPYDESKASRRVF